jgi:hypothetical protein
MLDWQKFGNEKDLATAWSPFGWNARCRNLRLLPLAAEDAVVSIREEFPHFLKFQTTELYAGCKDLYVGLFG